LGSQCGIIPNDNPVFQTTNRVATPSFTIQCASEKFVEYRIIYRTIHKKEHPGYPIHKAANKCRQRTSVVCVIVS